MNPNDTLRRGMSISGNVQEKPAPPIRRTPSINTNTLYQQQHYASNNTYVEMQSRMKARLKRAEEIAGQTELMRAQKLAELRNNQNSHEPPSNSEDDFPPPPPDFLLNNGSQSVSNGTAAAPPVPPASDHGSLLAEIQRGGFKLRKTVIERDRSAPRLK